MVECKFDFGKRRAGEGHGRIPKKAMMANEEISSGMNRRLNGSHASVNARSDLFNGAVIFDLESVVGAIEVGYFRAPGAGITESDYFLKGGHICRVRIAARVVKCFLASKFWRESANCK